MMPPSPPVSGHLHELSFRLEPCALRSRIGASFIHSSLSSNATSSVTFPDHPVQIGTFPPSWQSSPSQKIPILPSWWHVLLVKLSCSIMCFKLLHILLEDLIVTLIHIQNKHISKIFFNWIINEVTREKVNREVLVLQIDIQLKNVERNLQIDVKLAKMHSIDRMIINYIPPDTVCIPMDRNCIPNSFLQVNFCLYRVIKQPSRRQTKISHP